ncbi:MAG: LytR C-terminal domain-containing protein [Gemmatimonadaceae bacterium]|nr:LytR C-terminal domain-containing protein [Gemmatimonadaceae bacterium]MCW5825250.1 LytR C-terminal domain-containing protein [Gemmatimonadaceae bacterium]
MRVRGRWVLVVVALAVSGYVAWTQIRRPGGSAGALPRVAALERIVPDSVRIKIEVLNASDIRGLARRGTAMLRDLGFDVVSSGNAPEQLDSTVVWVRSGRMDWGELAAEALGGARVEARPDSSRYLDLTILLGRSWRPPAEAFYP